MDSIEKNLANWRTSRMKSIPLAGLFSRNPVAYSRKAPFRCWLLREAAFWRISDLLTQSHVLHQQGYCLGARILLRSAFETVATIIYLNQLIKQVLNDDLDFDTFTEKTSVLLLGSRDGSTNYKSLNIVTILQKCDEMYPGVENLYAKLSEAAHPNYEGMMTGYSRTDHNDFETHFSNRWMEIHGESHLAAMELCMMIFQTEYDDVWPKNIENLESWIVAHNDDL